MWNLMIAMRQGWKSVAGFVLVGLLSAGCERTSAPGEPDSGESAAVYLLTDEPPGARGVLEVRAELESNDQPGTAVDVVLVGRIGGVEGATWDPDRAAFSVQDLSAVEHAKVDEAPQHDADSCPYCREGKKKRLASTALVQVVDAQGNVPSVDARKLLGLEDGQTVVVRGTAQIDSLGNLTVRAAGVFVRPESAQATS